MLPQQTKSDDLFASVQHKSRAPLAARVRPHVLSDFVGQEHLLAKGKWLSKILEQDSLPSIILWGPPGVGKTTLALLIAQKKNYFFEALSAVSAGIKEMKELVEKAENVFSMSGRKTILFLDEIHRLNKSQQAYLLPFVEEGVITLIAATTENPSFEVISPLLSRSRVLVLNPLSDENLKEILKRALAYLKKEGEKIPFLEKEFEDALIQSAHGDARSLLNTLEASLQFASVNDRTIAPSHERTALNLSHLEQALQQTVLTHDKKGEDHYNVISAFIKSMRGSDPDAALYYMARLLQAGEDPLFVIRRMVIFASEDVGMADPHALMMATSCQQAFHFVGMPEGWIPMAHCAVYLATAPKSNASYAAYKEALKDVREHGSLPVPMHLRNAPTDLMKELGYAKGYQYAHDQKDAKVTHHHLPEKLIGKKYYRPA